jgi:gag-polyprotein putative aspartyl protease
LEEQLNGRNRATALSPFRFLRRSTAALSVGTVRFPTHATLNRYAILDTLDSDPVSPEVIRNIRSPSIALRVFLVGKISGKEISARALVDSGAEGMIIHENFAKQHKLTLQTLRQPLPAQNVNGSENKGGLISHTTIQRLRIGKPPTQHNEQAEFYVTNIGNYDIILRTDWLCHHNPIINWEKDTLELSHCPRTCKVTKQPPLCHSIRIQSIKTNHKDTLDEPDFPLHVAIAFIATEHKDPLNLEDKLEQAFRTAAICIRAKTTTATQLAQTMKTPHPLEEIIPPQFLQYKCIFNDQAAQRLPQRRPWDHGIKLKPNATRKDCGIY